LYPGIYNRKIASADATALNLATDLGGLSLISPNYITLQTGTGATQNNSIVVNQAGDVSVIGRTNLLGAVTIGKGFNAVEAHPTTGGYTPQIDISGTMNFTSAIQDFTDKPKIKLISQAIGSGFARPDSSTSQSANEIVGVGKNNSGFLRLSAENSTKSSIDLISTTSTSGYTNSIRFVTGSSERMLIDGSGDVSVYNTPSSNNHVANKAYVDNSIPIGGIIMWSGTVGSIPANWRMCDGETYGGRTTPNLRNKFIVGVSTDYYGTPYTTITGSHTQTGGTADAVVVSHNHSGYTNGGNNSGAHSHTVTDPGHEHSQNGGGATYAGGSGVHWTSNIYGSGPQQVTTLNKTGISVSGGDHYHPINADGVSGTNQNLPPYYALAFIMRIF
jgi:hypothetical protein